MYKTRKQLATAVSLALMGVAVQGQALAQSRFVLEETMVTARKVEESLQNAPLAVSAFSDEAMKARNADNILDIGSISPNVSLEMNGNLSGSSAHPSVFIRGVGSKDFQATDDPAVGIYLDGVYIARNVGNVLSLTDLERAEILRGPQGTLFGRNTIGGAVNLVSKKPHESLGGSLNLRLGEDSQVIARGSVNIPFSDNFFGRFSAGYTQRDGHIDLVNYSDKALGDDDKLGARAQFRWLASDTLTIDFAADMSKIDENGAPLITTDIDFTSGGPVQAVKAYNRDRSANPAVCTNPGDPAFANPANGCYGFHSLQDSRFKSGAVTVNNQGDVIDPISKVDTSGFHLNIEWELEWATFTSISAYREMESEFTREGDSAPQVVWQNWNENYDQDQFSQELQLAGTAFEDSLDWISGVYYFKENIEQAVTVQGFACGFGPFARFGPCPQATPPNNKEPVNTNMAAFAQGTYHFNDSSHLTLGLRYTDEEKDHWFQSDIVPNSPFQKTLQTQEWTYLVNYSHDISADIMAYGSFSTGFRSGGFPSRVLGSFPSLDGTDYSPEFVDVFELGLKGDFLDGKLRVNLAAFNTKYDDIQASGTGTLVAGGNPVPLIVNAGEATLNGLELELTLVPTDQLMIEWSLGLLDAELDSVEGVVTDDTVTITTDNELPFTPDMQSALGLSYSIPLNSAELVLRGDWVYTDDQYYAISNLSQVFQESYSVINASISYRPDRGRWQAQLGVKNLADEEYFTGAATTFSNGGHSMASVARPRHIFVSATYNFGDD